MVNETFDYVQYLDIKKHIDDRSLNTEVWRKFYGWLSDKKQNKQLDILEIGAGIGTMIERLLDNKLLHNCHYIALEPEADFMQTAQSRLGCWAGNNGLVFDQIGNGQWQLKGRELDVRISWVNASADHIDKLYADENFDLILSHAVIDLLPVPEIMPCILNKLKPAGGFYFSLNFSGQTRFTPTNEHDAEITRLYHADMDSRFSNLKWQASKTGVLLKPWLKNYGCSAVVDGSSDWHLTKSDQLFTENILDTIKKALAGLPELEAWLESRYIQLKQGGLELVISNRDCFGLK